MTWSCIFGKIVQGLLSLDLTRLLACKLEIATSKLGIHVPAGCLVPVHVSQADLVHCLHLQKLTQSWAPTRWSSARTNSKLEAALLLKSQDAQLQLCCNDKHEHTLMSYMDRDSA